MAPGNIHGGDIGTAVGGSGAGGIRTGVGAFGAVQHFGAFGGGGGAGGGMVDEEG